MSEINMTKDRVARITSWQDTRFPSQGQAGKPGFLGSGALEGISLGLHLGLSGREALPHCQR